MITFILMSNASVVPTEVPFAAGRCVVTLRAPPVCARVELRSPHDPAPSKVNRYIRTTVPLTVG